jgi:hypothetical protein
MEKINVTPLIKDDNSWTITSCKGCNLHDVKNKYLHKFVTDGKDTLHVTAMRFVPTEFNKFDYLVELIDDEQDASKFLQL